MRKEREKGEKKEIIKMNRKYKEIQIIKLKQNFTKP
jgi:hypothetical protein